jgi:hypothetical protein
MKKKCILILLTCSLVSALFLVTPAYAVTETCSHGNRTFNDRTLNGGVGAWGAANRYYWISSGLSNAGYTGYVQQAVSEWVNTTTTPGVSTAISIAQTSTQSSSSFDLYNESLSGSTTGLAKFYLYSTEYSDPSAQNWGWTEIKLDCTKHGNNNYSAGTRRGIVAHEFGHTMGLSHQPSLSTTSIMYNYDSRSMYRAATVDCNNINHLY